MLWSELSLILKTSSVTPGFFTFFIESYHFLPSVKVLKKSVCGKFLGANVLKILDRGYDDVKDSLVSKLNACARALINMQHGSLELSDF